MKKIISLILLISVLFSSVSLSGAFAEEVIFSDGFEKGMDNWTFWSGPSKEVNKILHDAYSEGQNSYYFYDNSDTTSVGINSKYIDIKGGETYTACADIYSLAGTVTMYFKYFNADSKSVLSKSMKGIVGQWSVVKITEKAPDDAVKCQVVLCGNNASLGEGFFDNVRIFKGDASPVISENIKAPSGSLAPEVKGPEDTYKVGDVIFCEEFEGDVFSRWRKRGAVTVDISKEFSKNGLCSLYVSDNSETTSGGIASESFPATPGEYYSATADVYNLSGSLPVYIKFFDAFGQQLSSVSAGDPELKFWGKIVVNSIAPENTKTVQVWVHTADASKRTGYMDNLKFMKEKTDVTYEEYEYIPPKQSPAVSASIVAPVNDKLVYSTYTDKGDKIGDFSYGGFYAGEYELPVSSNIPVIATVSPSGTDDDTKMLQDVIDKAYSENHDGGMKIIKLKAGRFNINKTGIRLKSGLLLSGEGQGPTGTILYAKDPQNYFLLRVEGEEPKKAGPDVLITDDYIPAGGKTFNIAKEDAASFKVGDFITIFYPSTDKWSEAIGMKGLTSTTGQDSSWDAGEVDLRNERVITAINGTEITVDFGLFVPNDKSYSQAYIYKTDDSGRIQNAGVENLRLESYYNGIMTDEQHATVAVAITNAKNVFVRDISAKYFYSSAVSCRQFSKQVTVLNCSSLQPVSQITGSRRYSFACGRDTQQLLYTGCYSYDGRHDFEASYPSGGPIAFVDNLADKSNSVSEAHGTWSNGLLYDNIYQVGNRTQGAIALANRGYYGTSLSQGWSSASSVVWNSLASTIMVNKPPLTYQNFVVGTWGIYQDEYSKIRYENHTNEYKKLYKTGTQATYNEANYITKEGSPVVGDCYVENEFTPVEPRSLFKAQLSERYTGSIKNARPNSPVLVYPRSDKETDDEKVTVSGVYQLGAEEVTIYIDNNPYKASLDSSNNTFSYTTELPEGVHKIYATQTIGGVEGTKTADRFIIIGKANGNPDYLQSIYSPDKTRMLVNDPRPTYDEYEKISKNKITVLINGEVLKSDVEPYETNGRVLVPMRAIFEALSATVGWDEQTSTATAKKGATEVKITENKTTTYVNGAPYELDVPATIKDGRFVVPVRFISESFGAEVGWIDETKTVVITEKNKKGVM